VRDYERVWIADRTALRRWLVDHYRQVDPIWLVTAKKSNGGYIPYAEIVEEALCFGWVDSLPRGLDAIYTMLLLSPRKAGSAWSKPNRERVARLIASGSMHTAGLAKVDAAKLDGSWDFLKIAESGAVPSDLATALATNPGARASYDAFSAPTRRRIVEYLMRAKRPETRASRLARIVEGARAGIDPLAWKPKA
jgi:uncharacterized protein YdeI (YjbR/CyaY-like superfamily)